MFRSYKRPASAPSGLATSPRTLPTALPTVFSMPPSPLLDDDCEPVVPVEV